MKKIYQLIPILVLLFTSLYSRASHVVGGDVSYTCTSSPGVYKVTLKVYRDCFGINFCSPGCTNAIPNGTTAGCTTSSAGFQTPITGAEGACNGVNFGSYTLSAASGANVYDIIQTCNATTTTAKTICTNCNTRNAGTVSPGMEVYIFEGNVNLNSLPSTCCKVALGFSICCRDFAITVFQSGNFYTEAIVNRCITPCNGAPIFTNDAAAIMCTNVDFVYNLGAIDPDGDSLSYALGESYQGPSAAVAWNAPYSATNPFPYLGFPNTAAQLPAGLRIDPATGDILFRPQGTFVSNLVIEVTQWRKVSGVYVNVGTTRRDVQFQSRLCPDNLPPRIKIYRNGVLQTTQTFSVIVGEQLCLDIVAEDQSQTSPSVINADTTTLTWNNPGPFNTAMANATWVANYVASQRGINGPKADSFKFCWTPPLSAVREQPHSFTVRGTDRYCPIPTFAIKGINITVSDKNITIQSSTQNEFCNNRSTSINMNYSAAANVNLALGNVFTAELSDSAGSFNNATVIGSKTDTSRSGSLPITIPGGLLKFGGGYAIRLRASSDISSFAVPFPIFIVQGYSQVSIINNGDSVCKGNQLLLRALPNTVGLNYKWLVNNNVLTGATNDTLYTDTTAALRVIVSNGFCNDTSTAKTLTIYPKPIVGFTSPNLVCLPNSVTFNNTSIISAGSLSYNWQFGDNTSSNVTSPIKTYTDTGSRVVKLIVTSNNNCVDSVTRNISVNESPTANFSINDGVQCIRNNQFVYTNTSLSSITNKWTLGDNTTSTGISPAPKTYASAGNYTVKLVANANGCLDSISKTISVVLPATSVAFAVNKQNQCLVNNSFVLTNNSSPNNSSLSYAWTFGNGNTSTLRAPTVVYSNKGNYNITLKVTANLKCVDSITSIVKVLASPVIGTISGNSSPSNPGLPFSYSVSTQPNTTNYNWTVNNGTIQSGQGSKTVSILFTNKGAAKIFAQIIDSSSCTDSTSLAINVQNVGLQNIDINTALSVYPNPSKMLVTISNKSKNLAGKEYSISNLVGQTLLSGKLGIEETQVNIESLSSGVYLLSIEGMSSQSIKVVKE